MDGPLDDIEWSVTYTDQDGKHYSKTLSDSQTLQVIQQDGVFYVLQGKYRKIFSLLYSGKDEEIAYRECRDCIDGYREGNMRIIDGCKKIYSAYGKQNQIEKLAEEAGELQEAAMIHREMDSIPTRNHMTEEMADVLVVMTQLIQAGVIDRVQLKAVMRQKIDRQLGRIADECRRLQ